VKKYVCLSGFFIGGRWPPFYFLFGASFSFSATHGREDH